MTDAAQTQEWDYQVRVNVAEQFAVAARAGCADPALKPLADILARHDAVLKNQFDAFADFCRDCEARGDLEHPLYDWTRKVVDNPAKQAAYATRFTVYADGGKETYAKSTADSLEAALQPLVGTLLTRVSKIDADPANNPQPPRQG